MDINGRYPMGMLDFPEAKSILPAVSAGDGQSRVCF
jgi:hypothetical protein